MTEALFDPEDDDYDPTGYAVARTDATAERYSFLKTKKIGEGWQEGNRYYRKGNTGVPVLRFD